MKLSRKVRYSLIGFLLMLNIAFRYPTTQHEIGRDTFYYHGLVNSISIFGSAKWMIHPLSAFGLYPGSEPSALLYVLSGASQCMGLDIECVILLFSMFLGVIGVLTSYMMARELNDNFFFALIVSFVFSTSPIFLSSTIWTISTRILVVAFLPLIFWTLIRSYKSSKNRWKYIAISQVLLVTLLATHLMSILLILIIFGYFISILLYSASKIIVVRTRYTVSLYLAFFILLIGIRIFHLIPEELVVLGKIESYSKGLLFSGTSSIVIFLNIIIDYASRIGLLSFFGLVGMIVLLKQKKNIEENFILLTLLIFSPLLIMGSYISLILLPFFCIIVGVGAFKVAQLLKNAKNVLIPVAIVCLLLSLFFSNFMINNWRSQKGESIYLSEQTINTGNFLREYDDGLFFISNNWGSCYKIWTVSDCPPLSWADLRLIYGLVNESQLKTEMLTFSEIIGSRGMLYKPVGQSDRLTDKRAWVTVMDNDCRDPRVTHILSEYKIYYAIEENEVRGKHIGYYTIYESPFYKSVHGGKYIVYMNEKDSLWYVG